jgi:NADH dehydrogenase
MATILITGGTGFVGTELRSHLLGHDVRVLVRPTEPPRVIEGATAVVGDVLQPETLTPALAGVDTVIHLVAIIEESGQNTFDRVIRKGTENIVAAASQSGVKRFIHMSAMGAQANPAYPYLNAKWGAEEAVRKSGMEWTIFRPSVIFGPGDGFINVLADLVRKAPIIPVVGTGASKFQPVAVADVADSFARSVNDPGTTSGNVFELGGARIYTYEEMLDTIATELGKTKRKIHVPVGLMKFVVAMTSPMPKALRPPVTSEQLRMLALDNCTDDSATGSLIGRTPVDLKDGIGYVRT